MRSLIPTKCALTASVAIVFGTVGVASAQFSNPKIDAISNAITQEPEVNPNDPVGTLQAKFGYWMSTKINMDWPVSNKMIRDSHDIDPKQDTDGDGTPDVDDEDIDGDDIPNSKDKDVDGDGVKNKKDNHPYDSTRQMQFPPGDSDGDGAPDDIDLFPEDPARQFSTPRMNRAFKSMMRHAF